MKVNVFGKKRTTKEGKSFVSYITKLTKKDGTELTAQVKFRETCGFPKNTPCTLIFEKKDANLTQTKETYFDEEKGEDVEYTRYVLWVNKFTEQEFVDNSLDDFE